ncbi:hypothetical protein NG798_24110 [Ancylothrix sp. C2]|uniref:hypothetical protein n=1 Tax=Ancylothrix sp. D3o TaxID=2953691 RepID=UPI0021BB0634|nr:hypothetical protein [Ancylothrix sp. D3o]MCT7952888.1 hypothetical protein [Ancylothrix sp. D3o]
MNNQTEDLDAVDDALEDLENERIQKLQQTIQDNKREIEKKKDDFRLIGYDYEVRNLEWALCNAQQPVDSLDYFQVLNLEWCCEIMLFPKPLLD